jgi:hypothetical protein
MLMSESLELSMLGKVRTQFLLCLGALFLLSDASAFDGDLVISAYQGICKEGDFAAKEASSQSASKTAATATEKPASKTDAADSPRR